MPVISLSLGLTLASPVLWAEAPRVPPEPLRQCQMLLRIEQDTLAYTKQLAALLLDRAETAEARVAELERQLAADKER